MGETYSCDDIYRMLETEILDLRIKPGQMLSEHSLCQRFEVSRTPIRSVLQRLQEKELVQIIPYKGTKVTLLDFDIINQIIYQRVAVETMLLRDFTRSCSPLDIETLRHALLTMEQLAADAATLPHRFYTADSNMHKIWFHKTGKLYLWECFEKAQSNYSRFRMLDIVEGKHFAEITAEHTEMLRIVEEKDIAAIEPLMQKHFYGGIRRLGQLIFTDFRAYFQPSALPD